MNAERLLTLAAALEDESRVPAAQFHFGHWGETTDTDSCGFTGCAIGHAAELGLFEGLALAYRTSLGVPSLSPSYRGARGVDAVALLFDIAPYQAEWLFVHDYDFGPYLAHKPREVTPAMVAVAIREFVAAHGSTSQ